MYKSGKKKQRMNASYAIHMGEQKKSGNNIEQKCAKLASKFKI